jgi:hypothetical protein
MEGLAGVDWVDLSMSETGVDGGGHSKGKQLPLAVHDSDSVDAHDSGGSSDIDDDSGSSSIVFWYPEYEAGVQTARVSSVRPAAYLKEFVTCSCAGDGDCQFSAVAQALNAYEGPVRAQLVAHLSVLKLTLGRIAALDLREAVCMLFLVDTPLLLPYLEHWKRQPCESTNAASAFLQHRRLDTMTQNERTQLFTMLMRRSCCWGDDVTLALLERVLRVRIDVFTPAGTLIKREELFAPDFVPIVFVALQLTMMHYETLAMMLSNGAVVTAWAAAHVPRAIIDANHALFAPGTAFRTVFDAWTGALQTSDDAVSAPRALTSHIDDDSAALVDAATTALSEYHVALAATRKRTRPSTPFGSSNAAGRKLTWSMANLTYPEPGGHGHYADKYKSTPVSPVAMSRDDAPEVFDEFSAFCADGGDRDGHVDDAAAAEAERIVADGGYQWMGATPLTRVAFLQCGAAVYSK